MITTKPINHPLVSSTYRATIKRIGTIPDDTPDDAGGRGRHFKPSETESLPLTPRATSPSVFTILIYGSVVCHPAKSDGRPRLCEYGLIKEYVSQGSKIYLAIMRKSL